MDEKDRAPLLACRGTVEDADRPAADLDPHAGRRKARLDAARLDGGEGAERADQNQEGEDDRHAARGASRADDANHNSWPAISAFSLSAFSSTAFQCGAIVSAR